MPCSFQCSLHECGYEEWNIKETRRFKMIWGSPGHSYPCSVNPDDPGMVVLQQSAPAAVVHAMVWPCLCLASGVVLWLGLCLGCWKIEMERDYPTARIDRNQLHML